MPTVRFATFSKDVAEGAGSLQQQVLLSAATDKVVTVVIEGASYRSGDMQIAPQTVTFQPGQTSATFTASVVNDSLYEGNEVFSYHMTSVTNAEVDKSVNPISIYGGGEFLGYIVDDDQPAGPTVRFATFSKDVAEGAGTLQQQVLLSAATDKVVTVVIEGASYRDGDMQIAPQTVTIQPGQTSATFTASVVNDSLYEGNEVFSYHMTSVINAEVDKSVNPISIYGGGEFLGYVLDDDQPSLPTVRFATFSKDVAEGAGNLQQQVLLSAATDKVVTVVIEGAAYRDGDMQIAAQTVTIQPGQTSATFTASVANDSLYEGNEVFSYHMTSVTNAEIDKSVNPISIYGGGEFLGYIIDDDQPSSGGGLGGGIPGLFMFATTANNSITGGTGPDTIVGVDVPDKLWGGEGADSVSGGSAFDDINGNQGNDTLHGGLGDDWVVGGRDDDLQFGDDGGDVVWGNLGNDTLDGGAGADQVRGGQGDDVMTGGAGDDYVSGDLGADIERGGTGADRFHTWGAAGVDRVLDFSQAEGDRVMLDPGTVYTVAQVGADTVINMAGGAQMTLVGVTLSALSEGWIFESWF